MRTSTKIKIAAVIAIIAGPFLTFTGHKEKERLALLEKDGITVDGTIEGGESRTGRRRSKSYAFDVSFAPKSGAPQTNSFKVKADFFKAHVTDDSISDPKVQVRYLPSDVSNAIVIGGSSDDTLLFPVGIGVFVLGLITAIVAFMRKESPTEVA